MDLSVIIPCYNSSSTITESIDSVIKSCIKTEYEWELIVVDDGSNDESLLKIEEYIETCPIKENIILVKQKNQGASVARNKGLELAKGEYIMFNDSDDRWLPEKVTIQMEFMKKHPEIFLAGYCYGNDNFSNRYILKLSDITEITIKNQVMKNYFAPPTVVFRRYILTHTGLFNENLRYSEEGYFFNNIVALFKSVYINKKVAEPVINKKRWGESGLSGNIIKMEGGELFNITNAYSKKYISFSRFIIAYCFSIAKFIRRFILSKCIKLCK